MPESRSHAPFAFQNRVVNPFVSALLRSPLHRPVSGRLLLITVTGRRTGREHTFPTGYERRGDEVRITVGWPERKRWWRNLTGEGGPVRLRIGGEERAGHAVARGDERSGVVVEIRLDPPGGAAATPRAQGPSERP